MKHDIEIEGSARRIARRGIEKEELKHGFQVPDEYKEFLLQQNGGHPKRCCFRFGKGTYMDSMISNFLAIGGPGYMNLAHFVEVYSDRLPSHVIPIADDPGGNLIVMSCEGKTRGAVYFWDHEKTGKQSIRRLAGSFEEFLSMLSEETEDEEDMFPVLISYQDGSSQRLELDAKLFCTDRQKVVKILDLEPGEGIELFGELKTILSVELAPRTTRK